MTGEPEFEYRVTIVWSGRSAATCTSEASARTTAKILSGDGRLCAVERRPVPEWERLAMFHRGEPYEPEESPVETSPILDA